MSPLLQFELQTPKKLQCAFAVQATEAQLQKVEEAAAAVTQEAVGQLLVHVRRGSAAGLWACALQSMSKHFAAALTDGVP